METIEVYDVFLSHCHQDAAWAAQLAGRLEDEAGLRVWLDRWELASEERWQQAAARELDQARSCVVCIGARVPHDWLEQAIQRGFRRQAQDPTFRVIPLLLPGAQAQLECDHRELRTWVDLRQGLDDMQEFERLVSIIPRIENPYSAGGLVQDARTFFGREKELRRIRNRLRKGDSTAVIGLRRIGKSSLLYQLAYQANLLPAGTVATYVDLQDAAHHEPLGLLNAVLEDLGKRLEGQFRFSPVKNLAEFSGTIKRMVAAGHRPVLCLDEMEELIQRRAFDDDFFEALRSLGNQRALAYVTASSQSLDVLLQQGGRTSPFYNLFLNLDLAGISDEGARALLKKPFRKVGLPEPSEEQIDDVLEWAGHHPFYLQMAAYHLFEMQAKSGGEPFDRLTLREAFARDAERHFRVLWGRLNKEQQAGVKRLSGLPAEVSNWEHTLASLLHYGVAEEKQGEPRLFGAVFADTVRTRALEREPSLPPPRATLDQRRPAQKKRSPLPEMLIAIFAAVGIITMILAVFSPSVALYATAGVASLAVILLVSLSGRRE